LKRKPEKRKKVPELWDGKASQRIKEIIKNNFNL